MRPIARIISALAVALSALVTVPTAAQADTPGYVTGAEFQRIGRGMDIRRVHRIFDTSGEQISFYGGTRYSPPEQWREYRTRSSSEYVTVYYEKRNGVWRVTAYWG